jgi:flagellar hook-length control protein FliK
VNVTPPNSSAIAAQSASPAQPKNLSLADLLFADSPANAASNFRAIAATLIGVESSTQTQSPVKSSSNVKKPGAGVSEEKLNPSNDKEMSSPALSDAPVQLLVPPQNVPMPLIQVSARPDTSDVGQRNTTEPLGSARPGLEGLSEQTQPKSDKGDKSAANLVTVALPGDHIPAAVYGKSGTPSIQTSSTEEVPKTLPANVPARKKEVEPAKSPADRSQPPAVPEIAKPPAPSLAATDRTKQSADSNLSGGQEKPSVAINTLPPTPPIEQTIDPSPNRVLESMAPAKAVSQSGLANPTTVAGSKSALGGDASNSTARIKGRDIKDSRITPTPSGKPGFIQPDQTLGGPITAGNGKDSPGFPLSGHSGAHGKPATVKLSADAPSSPASLADTDGPDETLPTSASSPVTAKFVQGMSQSEFRVGMQSQEFGNIDIRTSVARHLFSAQIYVEHSDVAKSMAAQLPGLYHRLADQQVAVGNIVIHGQSLGTSSGLAQDAQRQSWQPQGHSSDADTAKLNAEPILPVMTDGIDSAGRLDIRI